jgi:hypothetical protein
MHFSYSYPVVQRILYGKNVKKLETLEKDLKWLRDRHRGQKQCQEIFRQQRCPDRSHLFPRQGQIQRQSQGQSQLECRRRRWGLDTLP